MPYGRWLGSLQNKITKNTCSDLFIYQRLNAKEIYMDL